MPNIKGVAKRVITGERNKKDNALYKATMKKEIKALGKKIENKEKVLAKDLNMTNKAIDKAAKKGIIHKKTAARRKSRLAKKTNK